MRHGIRRLIPVAALVRPGAVGSGRQVLTMRASRKPTRTRLLAALLLVAAGTLFVASALADSGTAHLHHWGVVLMLVGAMPTFAAFFVHRKA